MAIENPSIKQIYANIINDIETETGQQIPTLAKMVLKVFSLALSGIWIVLYKYGSDSFKQRFPQTANDYFLAILGELVNVTRQDATNFRGVITCVGTTSSGIISANTQFINVKSGNIYLASESAYIANGSFTVKIKSTSSGANYNLAVNDILKFVSPVFGVNDSGTVSAITSLGQDAENIESYRQRVINAYKRKPQGGAAVDYQQWGTEPTAILNAYPYTNATLPGKFEIYVESSVQPDGIPTQDELDLCKQYIDFDMSTGMATRRPLTAEGNYYPISRKVYDIKIIGLSPDTVANRELVENAITDYMLELEPYILGVSVNRNDIMNTATLTAAVQNVLTPVEAFFSNLQVFAEGTTNIVYSEYMARGQKAKAGDIIYV